MPGLPADITVCPVCGQVKPTVPDDDRMHAYETCGACRAAGLGLAIVASVGMAADTYLASFRLAGEDGPR